MRHSCHNFFLKINLLLIGVFIFSKNIAAQEYEWIKEIPTGKVSVWITQLEPLNKGVFEFEIINGSQEFIDLDRFCINNNYFFLKNSKGDRVDPQVNVGGGCFPFEFELKLYPKTFKKWEINISNFLKRANAETGLTYTIFWEVGSSIGAFKARPVDFYFENKTN